METRTLSTTERGGEKETDRQTDGGRWTDRRMERQADRDLPKLFSGSTLLTLQMSEVFINWLLGHCNATVMQRLQLVPISVSLNGDRDIEYVAIQ